MIVNAAAYTAVDRAEAEPDVAQAVNGRAPGVLAEECARTGALLVHYSTDYVFDGLKPIPYEESDAVAPLNVYGATKLAGENAIRESGCRHLILRTSWVYSANGSNFLLTMLRLFRERAEVRVVDDQVGAPTSARLIAHTTVDLLNAGAFEQHSLLHLTASGHASWFQFAQAIKASTAAWRANEPKLVPIPSSGYPTPARRPLNSRLSLSRTQQILGRTLQTWEDGLRECLVDCAQDQRGGVRAS
jgi:dTDP-4-dehydrorhamnose reductase